MANRAERLEVVRHIFSTMSMMLDVVQLQMTRIRGVPFLMRPPTIRILALHPLFRAQWQQPAHSAA